MSNQTVITEKTTAELATGRRGQARKKGAAQTKTKQREAFLTEAVSGPGTEKFSRGIAKSLREKFGLSQSNFARLIGFSVRAIAGWEAESPISEVAGQRYKEIERLHSGLARIMNKAYISEWLKTPNPAFDDLKPLEVIERGEIDRIWNMIFYLESGEMV